MKKVQYRHSLFSKIFFYLYNNFRSRGINARDTKFFSLMADFEGRSNLNSVPGSGLGTLSLKVSASWYQKALTLHPGAVY